MNIAGAVMDFSGTGAWTTWANATFTLPLVAGTNTVRTTAVTAEGGPNLTPP
ncbi:hypothetical protein ABZ897_23980 [Nonomuraea sp. NPDC046802]|uniref:hypothetical protein n=1 Tax=Nonomuraea sp. NPDC046802 TaxID=3154919 RepID=UPI00340F85AA